MFCRVKNNGTAAGLIANDFTVAAVPLRVALMARVAGLEKRWQAYFA